MLENTNPLLMTFSDLKAYLTQWLSWQTFTLSAPLQHGIRCEVGGQVLIAQEHQPPPPEPDVRLVTASGSHEISYALLVGMGCMPDQKDVFRRNRHHGFF